MGINKVITTATSGINKLNTVAKASINKINTVVTSFATAFTDDNAVAKSITTGTAQAVYISDSDGEYNFDHNDAFSVSFWVKAGWSSSLNTSVYLFSSSNVSASNVNNDTFRFWYNESNNRLYSEWRQDGSNKRQNFWLFHSNSGNYAAAYSAAGLGGTYWSAANRGNVGNDDYTLITMTRGTTNSAASSNLKLYWNATDCGVGFYASGNHTGTPSMGTTDKQIALGSSTWTGFTKGGDSAETKFNGVTIWDKVLSADEVGELYNSGAPMDVSGHSAYDDSCSGWWNFESDGSNEVEDKPAFDVIAGNSNIEAK